jgi:hypothetical protein
VVGAYLLVATSRCSHARGNCPAFAPGAVVVVYSPTDQA